MPTAVVAGIPTAYEAVGSGPALLMFSPGGFDAVRSNWSSLGGYRQLRLVEQLSTRFTCVVFDRRESGGSGGRVERLSWAHYAQQGRQLLDHLGFADAHVMGGCVGCSIATTFAVRYPDAARSLVLFAPAGGPRYRMVQHGRFRQHLAFVAEHGLAAVVELARNCEQTFSQDGRVGPWVSLLRRDPTFAAQYAAFNPERYSLTVAATARLLFDRDTVPGPEPEDLMLLDVPALIVPGEDGSHAPSAARYLQECLVHAEYWDVPVAQRAEHNAAGRILDFLAAVEGRPVSR